ncbi:MAG: peroxiredoxin [Halioglobus sp.]|jgi:peroxiredoxin
MAQLEDYEVAPALDVSEWLNTPEPLSLDQLKGKVVVLHAFQMLCPGCVTHGVPQASAMHELYADDHLQVIGSTSRF